MHYRGFVFVPQPTDEFVKAAMEPYRKQEYPDGTFGKFDYYRIGGRHDGYLVSDAEMKARVTCRGFNFAESNEQIESNYCRASDLPADRREIHFFVDDGRWIECEEYVGGEIVNVAGFTDMLDAAIAAHPESYIIVVDAHG